MFNTCGKLNYKYLVNEQTNNKHRVHLLLVETHSSVFSGSGSPVFLSHLEESAALSSYLTPEVNNIFSKQLACIQHRRALSVRMLQKQMGLVKLNYDTLTLVKHVLYVDVIQTLISTCR